MSENLFACFGRCKTATLWRWLRVRCKDWANADRCKDRDDIGSHAARVAGWG